MPKKSVLILIFFLSGGAALFAQGENLTLKIAVMGPGDPLYFWFGHIALIIEDSSLGTSNFYDYGLFSFDNENFYLNFAFGRLLYSCGVSRTDLNYYIYQRSNRTFTVHTLDLPPETKLRIKQFADNNVLPENCDYYYHHFKDNCSTRIRDIIDLATNGQFYNQYGQKPSRLTLRDHVRRHTWFSPAADWFLSFIMGQVIDTPITAWDDMFLPSEVGKLIDEFYYTDDHGARRKLVSSSEAVFTSHGRPAVLDTPRKQWPTELVFSLALSAVFFLFFRMHSKDISCKSRVSRAGKIMSGVSVSFCSLVFGLCGSILYFMSLFTNHDYTFQNANMIFCSPLLLAAFPAGIGCIVTKDHFKFLKYNLLIRIIWLITAAGILISMLIKLLPPFYQDNLTDQLLMLPIALTFTCQPAGLRELLGRFFMRKNEKKGR